MTFRALTFNAMQSRAAMFYKNQSPAYTQWPLGKMTKKSASKTVLFSKVPSQALKDVISDRQL